MAEYLSKEDINTGEYISRDEALKAMQYCCENCDNYNGAMCRACDNADEMDIICDIPAADIQPFKWIRCEEALPVYDGLVLVADRDNNIRLGIFTEMGWLSQFGNPMMPRPKAWAKIPELPKSIKG